MAEKLTPKQEAFVREYLIDLNATQAAIRAGYSAKTARVTGPETLLKPAVAAAIEAAKATRVKRVLTNQDRVLRQMLAISESDIRDVLSFDDERGIRFIASGELSARAAASIQSVKSKTRYKPGKDGEEGDVEVEMEVKLHPKVPMIRTLAEHLGMLAAPAAPINITMPVLVIGDPRAWQGAPPDPAPSPPALKAKLIAPPTKKPPKKPPIDLDLTG